MFEEVRDAPLIVILLRRARRHNEPQLGAVLGPLIGTDVVAKPIAETADGDFRIRRQAQPVR